MSDISAVRHAVLFGCGVEVRVGLMHIALHCIKYKQKHRGTSGAEDRNGFM